MFISRTFKVLGVIFVLLGPFLTITDNVNKNQPLIEDLSELNFWSILSIIGISSYYLGRRRARSHIKGAIDNYETVLINDTGVAHSWSESSFFQKTVLIILFGIIILDFYGMFADFAPSRNAVTISRIISIIICVLLTFSLVWNSRKRWRYIWSGKSNIKKAFNFILFSIGLWLFIYIALAHGFMSLATYMSGKKIDITSIGIIKHSFVKGCDYRFESDFIKSAFPSYICFDGTIYAGSEGNVEATFEVVRSNFGVQVTKIKSIVWLASGL